jgi:hypothetical protein
MSGHLRIRAARSPQTKSLDTLDFNAQPLLNKTLILEPAWYEWIEQLRLHRAWVIRHR